MKRIKLFESWIDENNLDHPNPSIYNANEKELAEFISDAYKEDTIIPILFHSSPSVGLVSVSKWIVEKITHKAPIVLDLARVSPCKFMHVIEKCKGESGVVVFDHLDACESQVQSLAMTLMNERTLHEEGKTVELGSKWLTIGLLQHNGKNPISSVFSNKCVQANYVPVANEFAR